MGGDEIVVDMRSRRSIQRMVGRDKFYGGENKHFNTGIVIKRSLKVVLLVYGGCTAAPLPSVSAFFMLENILNVK